MSVGYADIQAGEFTDTKPAAAEAAQQLVEAIWRETTEAYDLTPLTALAIAQTIANAVLAGAVKERADILAEPFKPQLTRMMVDLMVGL